MAKKETRLTRRELLGKSASLGAGTALGILGLNVIGVPGFRESVRAVSSETAISWDTMRPETFVDILRTGRTKITKALDTLFADPGRLRSDPNFAEMQKEAAADGNAHFDSLPTWAKKRLESFLNAKDHARLCAHIDAWPNDQKEKVRKKLVQAIDENRRVRFFWELHRGENRATEIFDPGEGREIIITFRSPRKSITETHGRIKVNVG